MTRRTRDIIWLCWTFGLPAAVAVLVVLFVVRAAMLGMGGAS